MLIRSFISQIGSYAQWSAGVEAESRNGTRARRGNCLGSLIVGVIGATSGQRHVSGAATHSDGEVSGGMPVLSRFFGIVVFMNYNDHNPPHFHARYQDQEVIVEIDSGIVTGTMSQRALRLLFEWMDEHREELRANWKRARDRRPLLPIPPLT